MLKKFNDSRITVLKNESFAHLLGPRTLTAIYDKLAVFSHGLATMVCADLLVDTSDAYFIQTLLAVGADLMGSAIYRSGNMDFFHAWSHDPKYQSIDFNFSLTFKETGRNGT